MNVTATMDPAVFPGASTMLAVDITMTLLAIATSYIAVLRWPLLSRAEAKLGVALILSGFWCLAGLYIYDLFAMMVLPAWVGTAAAIEEIAMIHGRYSWYVHPTSAALIVAGLASTSKRLENLDEQLQASKREAEEQSAQKTNFLASMSHELRTPLNSIVGYAEFMQLDPIAGDKERCREYAANIQASAKMLHDLIADLLDLSRIEQGRIHLNLERIDLGDLAWECMEKIRATELAKDLEISLTVAPGMAPIYLDRRAIAQVMLNLITNSAKHTEANGLIKTVIYPTARGEARIVVADTGTGISGQVLDRIFDPYVSGDPMIRAKDGGYGLGLSICKRLIDAHGGSISIDSEPGRGATVTVTLPCNWQPVTAPQVSPELSGADRATA